MHPSHHQNLYYPNQPPTQPGPLIPSKAPWNASTPTATADSSFQTYPTSHTLQRPQPQLSSPFPHGPDMTGSGGAPHPTSAMWTATASMSGPGASETSHPPSYQSPALLSQNYPPPHLTSSGGGHLISNPAQSALPYPPYSSRAMDANQFAPLQSGSGGGSGALRNQGGRPSSSVVTRSVAGHPYVPHNQSAPSYGLRNRASVSGMLTTRRDLSSRSGKADDGSDGEYGDSDVDLEGPMKRTDGFGDFLGSFSAAHEFFPPFRHNLSTHERRRLYVSALETYITDTTSTMRNHGLEPPPIQRCVDNRGLTSDARLVSSIVDVMIRFDDNLQTMMAALDDEIQHLQQEIEGAEEQVRGTELTEALC